MSRELDDRELVELVLEFARQVNALQRRYAPRLAEARREGRMDALLTACRRDAETLYGRWLTRRKRSLYTPLPDRPTFAAVEKLTLGAVAREKNQAVVELLTSGGCLDFRFRLLRKNGEWRINGCQQRYHSGDRVDQWNDGVL